MPNTGAKYPRNLNKELFEKPKSLYLVLNQKSSKTNRN